MTWDSVRVGAEEVGSGVGKAKAVVMSSASAGSTKCERMALRLVLKMSVSEMEVNILGN